MRGISDSAMRYEKKPENICSAGSDIYVFDIFSFKKKEIFCFTFLKL